MSTQSNVYSVVGTELHVAVGTPATYDKSGFEAMPWVRVGEITELGEFGANAGTAEHQPLATGTTVKRKGFINFGQLNCSMGRDVTDAGQVVLKNGSEGPTKYLVHSWKIVHQSGLVQYVTGTIHSYTTNIPGGDAVVTAATMAELDNQILDILPPPQYTLVYQAAPGGSVTGELVQVVVDGGDGETVTAVPDSGYEFSQWSDGVATAERTDTAVTGNISVTAEFTLL